MTFGIHTHTQNIHVPSPYVLCKTQHMCGTKLFKIHIYILCDAVTHATSIKIFPSNSLGKRGFSFSLITYVCTMYIRTRQKYCMYATNEHKTFTHRSADSPSSHLFGNTIIITLYSTCVSVLVFVGGGGGYKVHMGWQASVQSHVYSFTVPIIRCTQNILTLPPQEMPILIQSKERGRKNKKKSLVWNPSICRTEKGTILQKHNVSMISIYDENDINI